MKKNRISPSFPFVVAAALCLPLLPSPALAQKGVGDEVGIVRQGLRPALVKLSAEITSVEIHPCEKTTGPSPQGAHLLAKSADGLEYNLHLGPADVLTRLTKHCRPGMQIEVLAFRTPKLNDNHYIVASIRLKENGVVFRLRDSNLRPQWSRRSRLEAADHQQQPRQRGARRGR